MSPARPHPSPRRHRLRLTTAALVGGALVAVSAGAAQAHVRVHPDSTASGSFSQLTFRIPNESDTAGTVKVSVTLPQDTPFLSVSSKPVPGWTAAAVEATLPRPVDDDGTTVTRAVRTVTWSADPGTRIGPGQYQEFSVSVGPLPAPGTVVLPTTQTYSDGEVVAWDQQASASGEEPQHPVPQFEVTAATSDSHGASNASTPSAAVSTPSSSDATARWLAVGALLVALVAVALGAFASRRRPRGAGGTPA